MNQAGPQSLRSHSGRTSCSMSTDADREKTSENSRTKKETKGKHRHDGTLPLISLKKCPMNNKMISNAILSMLLDINSLCPKVT